MGRRAEAGPVRTWAEMTAEERARISATSKPPPPTPIAPSGRESDKEEETVVVACLVKVHETAKAVLYEVADVGKQWVPKSLIRDEDVMDDGTLLVRIPRRFAEEKGIANDE